MSNEENSNSVISGVRFGSGFWQDHARNLITDPKLAIVEIVANAWDAGADHVYIDWPSTRGKVISIRDNGTGMTKQEFQDRWTELNYSRIHAQGTEVRFPHDNKKSKRRVFGRNGKGRHSMFCFDFEYTVRTWRDGTSHTFRVTRGSGREPFSILLSEILEQDGHGTEVSGYYNLPDSFISAKTISELIGSKFIADPSFQIYVNNERIELSDLENVAEKTEISIASFGKVEIYLLDSQLTGRLSKHHGVAWWVNNRLVGEPGWKGVDVGKYLDARTSQAKRYTFVVIADVLADDVKFDWTGFVESERAIQVISRVNEHILDAIQTLFQDVRRERKKEVIRGAKDRLRALPKTSWSYISRFIDGIQMESPTLGQKELAATVEVLAKLEESRTGYKLLEQLAQLPSDDLDALSDLLSKWSVREAQLVLEEIEHRLNLIRQLEQVIEVKSDELHAIHPLFERGLWIFGPEYESIEYTSNRTLLTVIRNLLGDQSYMPTTPKKRPDFVATPNSSLELYSCESFDDRAEVDGIRKLLIIELKRGGFEITGDEVAQAEKYAKEIAKSGKTKRNATIVCFILGTTISDDVEEIAVKQFRDVTINLYPRTYSTLLRAAEARIFHLKKKLEELDVDEGIDTDVANILSEPVQPKLVGL